MDKTRFWAGATVGLLAGTVISALGHHWAFMLILLLPSAGMWIVRSVGR